MKYFVNIIVFPLIKLNEKCLNFPEWHICKFNIITWQHFYKDNRWMNVNSVTIIIRVLSKHQWSLHSWIMTYMSAIFPSSGKVIYKDQPNNFSQTRVKPYIKWWTGTYIFNTMIKTMLIFIPDQQNLIQWKHTVPAMDIRNVKFIIIISTNKWSIIWR